MIETVREYKSWKKKIATSKVLVSIWYYLSSAQINSKCVTVSLTIETLLNLSTCICWILQMEIIKNSQRVMEIQRCTVYSSKCMMDWSLLTLWTQMRGKCTSSLLKGIWYFCSSKATTRLQWWWLKWSLHFWVRLWNTNKFLCISHLWPSIMDKIKSNLIM